MKETYLLTHNQTINNTYYLLERAIDSIFVGEVGAKETILNNSLKTMNLISNADNLWESQRFQDMFQSYVEHSF